jgi:hypothetical protein
MLRRSLASLKPEFFRSLLGDPIRSVALNKLSAYKEDASQTAARIVREATTED